MGRLRVLLFDLDDTLVVEDAAATTAFRATETVPGLDAGALAATPRVRGRELWNASPTHP